MKTLWAVQHETKGLKGRRWNNKIAKAESVNTGSTWFNTVTLVGQLGGGYTWVKKTHVTNLFPLACIRYFSIKRPFIAYMLVYPFCQWFPLKVRGHSLKAAENLELWNPTYDATLHISNTVFRLGTSPARLNNCHEKRPIVDIWYDVFWMCIQDSQCSPFCCCSGEGTNLSNAPQCYDNGSIMFCYLNAYARIHHQPVQTYILDFFCWKSKSHMFNQK